MAPEMSYAYDDCELSRPFEFEWVNKFKKKIQDNKLILVGNGITADEFSVVFKKNKLNFEQITPQKFLEFIKIDLINQNCGNFYLFASPSMANELRGSANAVGLVSGVDYFSYTQTIRNRFIVDLRVPYPLIDLGGLTRAFHFISKIPTMAGVDIMSADSRSVADIESVLKLFRNTLHIKVILFPLNESHIDTSILKSAEVIELNCSAINIEEKKAAELLKKLKYTLKVDRRVLLLASARLKAVADEGNWGAVFYEKNHPKYYDQLLMKLESGSTIDGIEFKMGDMCLSRRMFPVIDKRLKLKTCSLYGEIAMTDHAIDSLDARDFIGNREALCKRCINKKLHRMI